MRHQRHGEGRIEPVEVVVLPRGRSLDFCIARTKGVVPQSYATERVGANSARSSAADADATNTMHAHVRSTKRPAPNAKAAKLALNVELLDVQAQLNKLRKKAAEAKGRMKRHPQLRAQLADTLSAYAEQIRTLESQEKQVDAKRARSVGRKKLSVF